MTRVLPRVTNVEEGIFLSPQTVSRLPVVVLDSKEKEIDRAFNQIEGQLHAIQRRIRSKISSATLKATMDVASKNIEERIIKELRLIQGAPVQGVASTTHSDLSRKPPAIRSKL